MSGLKYWIWLTSLRLLGSAKAGIALDYFGSPENAFFADEEELSLVEGLTASDRIQLADKDLDRAERILEQCEMGGVGIVTLQDAQYPDRLKNIPNAPPCVLYIKGKLPVMDEEPAIAVVGSRSFTPYGHQAASNMAAGMAAAGMTIVSGLARGIDASAQNAALLAGGNVVAVLGCGVDVIYPAENARLYHDIAAAGCILSEYPPGTPVLGSNFPTRNRIMSGLSLGVLVVEAPSHSGALITARHALEQGRDVFAVPGNIDSPESAGSNRLLREGATLVTCPDDILQEYAALYPHKITQKQWQPSYIMPAEALEAKTALRVAEEVKRPAVSPGKMKKSGSARAFDLSDAIKDFTTEGQAIIIAVAGRPRPVDEIVEITQIPASRVLRELTMLELAGAVRTLPGQRFEMILGQ